MLQNIYTFPYEFEFTAVLKRYISFKFCISYSYCFTLKFFYGIVYYTEKYTAAQSEPRDNAGLINDVCFASRISTQRTESTTEIYARGQQ